MEQTQVTDQPVLDKIELLLPPRLTLMLTALALKRNLTLNEIILYAIWDHIEKSKQ